MTQLQNKKLKHSASEQLLTVENSQHQVILEKLLNRPFMKQNALTSVSTKNFMVEAYTDGLHEDMLIFEHNFVKNYPQFASTYVNNVSKYGGGCSQKHDSLAFLDTYDKLVKPQRWQKVFKSIDPHYTKDTTNKVFKDRYNQGTLFQSVKDTQQQKQKFEVFLSNKALKKRNIIMYALQGKIKMKLHNMSEQIIRQKLDGHNRRRNERLAGELNLPSINSYGKIAVDQFDMHQSMKRVFSETDLTKDGILGNDIREEDIHSRNNRQYEKYGNIGMKGYTIGIGDTTTQLTKNNDTTVMINIKQDNSHLFGSFQNNRSQYIKLQNSEDDRSRPNQIQSQNQLQAEGNFERRGSIFKKGDSSPATRKNAINSNQVSFSQVSPKLFPPLTRKDSVTTITTDQCNEEIDDDLKEHLAVTSSIMSIQKIIQRVQQEMQKPITQVDTELVLEQFGLAETFVEQLKQSPLYEGLLNSQIKEVLSRIDTVIKTFQQKKADQQNSISPVKKRRQLKAKFMQKLSILQIYQNQLKNTSTKYPKFYQNISETQQKKLSQTEKKLTLPLIQQSPQKKVEFIKIKKDQKNAQKEQIKKNAVIDNFDGSRIENSTNTNNPSIILNDTAGLETLLNNQSSVINVDKTNSLNNKLPLAGSLLTRNSMKIKFGSSMSQKNISLFPVKKQPIDQLAELVKQKNLSKNLCEVQVEEATAKALRELEPYQYYDEVIADYFKDQKILNTKQSQLLRTEIVETTMKDMIVLELEDVMTNQNAVLEANYHLRNESKLTFKEKQAKSLLVDYMRQLPNAATGSKHRKIDPQSRAVSNQNIEINDSDRENQNSQAEEASPVIRGASRKEVGYDALLYIQELKMFHNENDIPMLIERYLKKFGATGEPADYQKKNLVFYRRQLDLIEQKLITIAQKFN